MFVGTLRGGYGRIRIGNEFRSVHRVAWELANGRDVPEGLVVRHVCDNRACFLPTHLEVGTHADNSADAVARGRTFHPRGVLCGAHKLTEADVQSIRQRYVPGSRPRGRGTSSSELAEEFGVTTTQIRNIYKRRQWSHV